MYNIDIEEEEHSQVRIDGEVEVALDRTTGRNTRIISDSIHTESLASGNNWSSGSRDKTQVLWIIWIWRLGSGLSLDLLPSITGTCSGSSVVTLVWMMKSTSGFMKRHHWDRTIQVVSYQWSILHIPQVPSLCNLDLFILLWVFFLIFGTSFIFEM